MERRISVGTRWEYSLFKESEKARCTRHNVRMRNQLFIEKGKTERGDAKANPIYQEKTERLLQQELEKNIDSSGYYHFNMKYSRLRQIISKRKRICYIKVAHKLHSTEVLRKIQFIDNLISIMLSLLNSF